MSAPLITDPVAKNPVSSEEIERIRNAWPAESSLICTSCADIPRAHPTGKNELVCLFCKFSTCNPHLYFRQRIISIYRQESQAAA